MSRRPPPDRAGGEAGPEAGVEAVEAVEVLARAKINPYLAVGPRRRDGYHVLATVMQTVDLVDTVVLRPARARSVTFTRGWRFEGALPQPPDLVAQALALFAAEVPGSPPLAAEVAKCIPMAAGLAGGSSDAAAALVGAEAINARAGRPTPRLRLEALCHDLGSDVAFCLRGGTAFAGGRGDELAPLPARHRIWWVLGISEFPLSTPDVYRRFDELSASALEGAAQAEGGEGRLARPQGLIAALTNGHPKAIGGALRNDLEAAAFDLAPVLAGLKKALLAAGAMGVTLSGSGPTLAGVCRDEAHAEEVAARAGPSFARIEVVASTRVGAEVLPATS
ncbi:MAG: 4-(cytidine 5'-diphospho)-2-C-methyl-D-erythritol kinase [Actinomycetota bacterium]